jgi:hypothetical protein
VPAPRGNKYAIGNKGGRASAYKAQFAEQARKLCEFGATDAEIAHFFGVAISTIYLWKVQHKEFSEATKIGKRIADARVEHSLYLRAVGYSHDAVRIFKADRGKKPIYARYIEHIPPDVEAAKFWLRNRRPDKWRDRVEIERTGSLSDRSPEELKRLLVKRMVEWKLVDPANVPPDLLMPPDGTIDDD